ncbi:MAG TPA: hypothetical protein VHJ19_11745 [Gammaproteobacteria bacterium]|nr:hypothetical protein [Gammaproteobacteria bacterium]
MIFDALPVERALTSALDELRLPQARIDVCHAGQQWHWDNVGFEILYPMASGTTSGNKRSCVLRVANSGGAVLLTGDTEEDAEMLLLCNQTKRLKSDVLAVRHHGSSTS